MPINKVTVEDLNKVLDKYKKGEVTLPKTITKDFSEIDRTLEKNANILSDIGIWDDKEYENYRDYDVTLTRRKTEEELQQERAKNQSAWEQTGNFLAQAVGNEVVLGTFLGFSNLVDAAINLFDKEGNNDYTNPVSEWLEGLQNDLRERFEIYRENPNETFALGDFGWWADNAVSIASTASMLIPGIGIAKGISLLGKATRIGLGKLGRLGKAASKASLSRGLAKAATKVGIAKNTSTLAKSFNVTTKIATNAVIQRTMENYQEARGVYTEVLDSTMKELQKMTPEQKQKLIENNPQFEGKTDEEIAQYIAGESADTTFKNDYAMLLFDMAQLRAIGVLWGKLGKKAVTGALRGANKNAINNLIKGEEKAATKLGFLNKRLDNAKYALKNPLSSVAAIEWSEGLEEGYQGIQTEKGKEVAKKYLDPNYNERTLDDYLTDSSIWEQAFWGVLGGVGFQVAGDGLGHLAKKVKGQLKKDKLTDEEFALTQLSDEKIREKEITTRQEIMQDYIDKMQLINAGYNPFDYKKDDAGEAILQDGSKIFGEVTTKQEADMLKENVTNDFVTNISLNATDVGNYELLKDFVKDPNFNKFFEQSGLTDNNITQLLLDRMDNANEIYSQALHDVLTNTDVDNQNVAKVAARHIARNRFRQEEFEKHINNIENAINEDPDASTVTNDFIESRRADYINKNLDALYKAESEYIKANQSGELNDISFNIVKDRINTKRKALLDYAKERSPFGNIEAVKEKLKDTINENEINDFVNTFKEYYKTITQNTEKSTLPKQELQDLVDDKVKSETQVLTNEALIPKTEQDYKKLYDDIAKELDKATIERYNAAAEKIAKYLEDANDIKTAQKDLLEGNVNKDLKEALDIVKIGSKNTNKFLTLINSVANIVQNDKARKAEAAETIEEDGKPISKEKVQVIKQEVETINPPTGDQTQEETTETSDVINVENPAEFVPVEEVENIIDKIDSISIEQAKLDETDFVLNIDDRAALYAQDVVIDLFRTSPATLEGITSVDDSDANFTKIVDYVTDQIILKGVSAGIARQAAKNGIKLAFDVRAIAMRNKNPDEASKFKRLSAEIAIRSTIKTDGKQAAITSLLSDKQFNDIVNAFMESYIKSHNITPNKNGVYYIDVLDLFDALLDKDNPQSYDTVRHIFRNLKDYILNFRGKKLKFINTKLLNEHLKNPESFIAALIEAKSTTKIVDNYMHIKSATKQDSKYDETVRSLTNNSLVDVTDTGNSIDISKDGVQIGYITKVKAGEDNNSYRLVQQDNGIVWEASQNPDKSISSNMDNLFTEIINEETESGKDIYEAVQRAKEISTNVNSNTQITGADWNTLMANAEFKRLYENGDIKIPDTKKTNAQKAGYILNKLANIIFYDNTLSDKNALLHSYNSWKYNIFNNYRNTNEIQNKLKKNKNGITIKIAGIKGGTLKYSNINRNVNELGFIGTSNPIVAVMQDGSIMSEGSNKIYSNTAGFRSNTMGYLINDNPNAPMIALVTETNKLIDNLSLASDVANELTNLISDFTSGKISIEELGQSLQDLLGSYGSNNHNNLFSGYSVIRDKGNNFVALNINDKISQHNGKYALVINKNGSIVHIKNGDVNTTTRFTKYDGKLVRSVVDDIVSRLTFNKTFFAIRNNTNSNTNNNKYVYKRNGKLHVKIGGRETIYDNFADFSIKNNAFKTNQGGNAITGYYNTDSSVDSLYINVDTISSPVEGTDAKIDKQSVTNLIRSATKDSPVNTRDVLRAAGYSNRYINALLGINEFNIPIIDESIYYDEDTTHAEGYHRNGKVYITTKGSGRESLDRPLNLMRLIIHESLHKRFANEGLFEGKEHLVDELMDTYNAFMEALSKDDSDEANEIKAWLDKYSFTPDKYFTKLSEEEAERWVNRTEEERRRQFAEEWLAESLSQPKIISYLNKTHYDGAIVSKTDDSKKSIWQKIIDILVRLFDKTVGNVKDNTILAKQYLILGNEYGTTIENKNDTDVTESTEIKDNINAQTETIEQSTTKKHERRERDYAVTDIIGEILLSPKGTPSNLTREQYYQVRTKEFKDWFGDWENDPDNASKVLDENGEPLIVYHGTNTEFDSFKNDNQNLLFHFGSKEAAIQRANTKQGEYHEIAAFLNIRNIYDLEDSSNLELSTGLLSELYREGHITKEQYAELRDSNNIKEDIVKVLGKDFGIRYTNKYEDVGSKSYSVIDNNQIKRIDNNKKYAITDIIATPEEIYADAYSNDNSVNPIGIQVVPDMNTFIDQFPEHEKPLIASMIENNEIKFSCE